MSWKEIFPKDSIYYETKYGILYCGDCLEIMPKFPEKIFDAIITDPPYGTTACKWDTVIPFEDMWRELKRIRKDRTPIVLFGSEPFSSYLRISNIKEYKYDWVWNKISGVNFLNIKNRPFKTHENIIIFADNANFTFNPIRTPRSPKSLLRQPKGKKRIIKRKGHIEVYDTKLESVIEILSDGLKHPVSIITFSRAEKGRYKYKHPTKKPLALLEYLVKTYTNEGDLVLDFTCGSGTTLVACEKLNRRWIGIEINKEYCEIAVNRVKEWENTLFC